MTVVSKDRGVVFLNVFAVEPGAADELIAHFGRATEAVICRLPGFVSANLHRSKDGTRVANYAQWRSRADFEAMVQNPQVREQMSAGQQMGRPEGALYEVAHVQQARTEVTIAAGSSPWTLIVVMKCEPAEQDEVTTYLIGIAREHSASPGFISCTIHRSFDGTRVAEYIQWRDQAAIGAMAAKSASQAHFARVKHRSSSAPYDVVATFAPAAET
jgi:heme-degrading monooxygenase HmoA